MTDTLSRERRSANMRRIRSVDTQPEIAVRKLCRGLGHGGYRVHPKNLPGKPDIAWVRKKAAVFVHGCFWHGHDCVEGNRRPLSNRDYWLRKIDSNSQRDADNIASLRRMNWSVCVIWECEVPDEGSVVGKLSRFLGSTNPGA